MCSFNEMIDFSLCVVEGLEGVGSLWLCMFCDCGVVSVFCVCVCVGWIRNGQVGIMIVQCGRIQC